MITSAGSDRSFYVAKIISEFFPPNKDFSDFKVLDLAAGTGVLGPYDIVIIAGGFAQGHMNIQVLRQAARVLKKGNHV